MSFQKRVKEKSCNCRNSKCMKLYCQCFATQKPCTQSCLCINCHNKGTQQFKNNLKDHSAIGFQKRFTDNGKTGKGCACRKSGCTKKYCECFQSGMTCTQSCKCIECQNNQSLSNKKIINELKRYQSDSNSKSANLYSLILSQNSQQINNIISQSNPLNLDNNYLQKRVKQLIQKGNQGGQVGILQYFMDILDDIQKLAIQKKQSIKQQQSQQQKMLKQNHMKDQNIDQQMDIQDYNSDLSNYDDDQDQDNDYYHYNEKKQQKEKNNFQKQQELHFQSISLENKNQQDQEKKSIKQQKNYQKKDNDEQMKQQ